MEKIENSYTNDDILKDNNPLIRQISEPVTFPLSKEEKNVIEKMKNYLINSNQENVNLSLFTPALGLAAPQVGLLKRIIFCHFKSFNDDGSINQEKLTLLINPEIIGHSQNLAYLSEGEGCLSVKKKYEGYTHRYYKIIVKYQTIKGESKEATLFGLNSLVCQHEIDHLNGVLFYDYIAKNNPFFIPSGSIEI